MSTAETALQETLTAISQAESSGKISKTALENLRCWLTEDRYSEYRDQIIAHVREGQWQELDDAFWTIIPFGTGGRRGRMYPIGSNAINDRTIGESAQGLADYVVEYSGGKQGLSCAIAYDTRHRSRHFAELCAGVMVAAGFKVYFLDDYRATPQLSFAVRHKNCDCGIMVTASHNPPSDNAVKVYWSSGAQVLPPHDKAIIQRVMNCQQIKSVPFADALADGRVEIVTKEIDEAFLDATIACRFDGPREVKILYSPLHGVGTEAVIPLLQRDGFRDVEVYGPHAEKSGDFPNVPGHVSNPENYAVFEKPIEYARENGFDVILATDPDCDRLGVAAPQTLDTAGPWGTFTGNQLAAMMGDFILSKRSAAGTLTANHFVVTTLVTTAMIRRISESYNARCIDDLLVGFKHIAAAVDREGPDNFVFGTEESHGYVVGQYARDKDGAVACMLICELAAELKSKGQTLHDYLAELYHKHGYHHEKTLSLFMEGSEGMAAMKRLMQAFRDNPPKTLAGIAVSRVRDYLNGSIRSADGTTETLQGPVGDLVIIDLADEGNYVAARPSGTEPKIKLYAFTRLPATESADLQAAREKLNARMDDLERDLRAYASENS